MAGEKGRERRQYPRLGLRAFAQLSSSEAEWGVHILDISRSGARIAVLDEYTLELGDIIDLTIDIQALGVGSGALRLRGQLVHLREHIVGLKYEPLTATDSLGLDALLESDLAKNAAIVD